MLSLHSSDLAGWADVVGNEPIAALRRSGQHLATRLDDLSEILKAVGAKRPLLVIDRRAVDGAALGDLLRQQLAGVAVTEFDRFTSNPRYDDAVAAARSATAHRADAVLGLGGGSCIDIAKIAALAARSPDNLAAIALGEPLDGAGTLPIVAIPTTSGSGSEATHFAVIYQEGRKTSIAHPAIRPAAVLLDVRFHAAMPRQLAAVTGLDALCQSLESLWAVGATAASIQFAEFAARLLAATLEASVIEGSQRHRLAVMIGAHLAGQAINISKTTAAHALSYELTTSHGVPHGHAVALTLGWIGAMNHGVSAHDCCDSRGPEDVRRRVALAASMLQCEPPQLPHTIHSLLTRLGLPATLGEVGVSAASIPKLAASVDAVRLSNNPRRLGSDQIEDLLRRAMAAPDQQGEPI